MGLCALLDDLSMGMFCRYPNLNKCCLKKRQVAHLYDGIIDPKEFEDEAEVQQPSNTRKTSGRWSL